MKHVYYVFTVTYILLIPAFLNAISELHEKLCNYINSKIFKK